MTTRPHPEAPHSRMSGEDRKRQLIETAIDLFSRKGFGGTTTREIAAAAGVTEAIIFRHFATKEEFYTAILDYIDRASGIDQWMVEAQAFVDRTDTEGLFRLIVTRIIEVHRTASKFERLMLHAALEEHELAMMHHNKMTLSIGRRIREYILSRQDAGEIRRSDPSVIIYSAVGFAQFYGMQKYLYQFCEGVPSDDQSIETFVRILMDGLHIGSGGNQVF